MAHKYRSFRAPRRIVRSLARKRSLETRSLGTRSLGIRSLGIRSFPTYAESVEQPA
jgi:hypothetical protein